MAEEPSASEGKQDESKTTVTQADLNKFRAAYDTQIAKLSSELTETRKGLTEAQADLKLATEAQPDKAKELERERELRRRESQLSGKLEQVESALRATRAVQLAAEAKAVHGVEIDPEELAKLPDEGAMAIAVLRKVSTAKPKERRPVGTSQPTQTRYGGDNLSAGVERFLREQGRVP